MGHLWIFILIALDAAIRTNLDEYNLLVAIEDAVVDFLTGNGFAHNIIITQMHNPIAPFSKGKTQLPIFPKPI
jgi:hypothetical protein